MRRLINLLFIILCIPFVGVILLPLQALYIIFTPVRKRKK